MKKYNMSSLMNFAASLIIVYYHSYALFYGTNGGKGEFISSFLHNSNLGALMVTFFFVSSGYFLTLSFTKRNDVINFIYKRIKRIVPALFVVLALTVFLVVPLCSENGFINEIINLNKEKFDYIFDNLFFIKNTKYSISTVFSTNPYPKVLNGSIWTIKHQMFTYFFFLVLYKLNFLKKERIMFVLIPLLIVTLGLQFGYFDGSLYFVKAKLWYIGILNEVVQLVTYTYYFVSGIFLYLHKDYIKFKPSVFYVLILITLIFNKFNLLTSICIFTLPYIYLYI